MTTHSPTLKISIFQLNSTASIQDNQDQINSLIEKNNLQNTDLWTFPECALHRPQNQKESLAFPLTETIIPWFQKLAITHKKWIY